jgi:hypothetical protein
LDNHLQKGYFSIKISITNDEERSRESFGVAGELRRLRPEAGQKSDLIFKGKIKQTETPRPGGQVFVTSPSCYREIALSTSLVAVDRVKRNTYSSGPVVLVHY